MADLTVQLDTSEADQRLKKLAKWLSPQQAARAGAAAINRALLAARTVGSRGVRRELRLRARDVKKRIDTDRATPADLEGVLRFDYEQIPLALYGNPRQVRDGVAVTIKKGGKRVTIPSAFISDQLGGQVVRRVRAGESDRLVPRGPVRRLYGPSIGSQLEKARPAMDRRANEVMRERIAHELEWRAERANR